MNDQINTIFNKKTQYVHRKAKLDLIIILIVHYLLYTINISSDVSMYLEICVLGDMSIKFRLRTYRI